MTDFKELEAKHAERLVFYATECGKLLNDFRNKLIREEEYGNREDSNYAKLRRMNDETNAAEQALIAEIKRLQEIEREHTACVHREDCDNYKAG